MTDAADLLDRARTLADTVLFPRAARIDQQELITWNDLAPLADAGLFAIGDGSVDARTTRRLVAAIGGGCGASFFCWVQHHGVVRLLSSSPNETLRTKWLGPLLGGEMLAGTAFAHLRRVGDPAVRATRCEGGWRFDGFAPWATSWGVATTFSIAAASDDGEAVWAMIDGVDQDALSAEPLRLPVFSATGTVAFRFNGVVVPDESVALVTNLDDWRRADRIKAALGQPAVLGVAERAIDLLADRQDADSLAAADSLRAQLVDRWSTDDRLVAGLSPSHADFTAMSDHRAACLALARSATAALLAGVGGAGMDLDHPAQRLGREAMFYTIQAQTADGRAATLRAVSGAGGGEHVTGG